jgi:uncharacterized protein YhbP (UPF0306 family)
MAIQKKLTKKMVLDFLAEGKQMAIATYGDHPWIATVYYVFDGNLNIYFLSSQKTLHVKNILRNQEVAIAIAAGNQPISKPKRGLQMYGVAEQIYGLEKVKYSLKLWKTNLSVINPALTAKAVNGKMFKVVPKRIKLFDQTLFKVEDGSEPVLELG